MCPCSAGGRSRPFDMDSGKLHSYQVPQDRHSLALGGLPPGLETLDISLNTRDASF